MPITSLMRGLAIKLILFCGVVEGLQQLQFTVLLAGTAVVLAGIVLSDYVFRVKAGS